MEINRTAPDQSVAALRLKVSDQFSGWAIDGALRALADNDNPLRLNFFSTAMRILFEHVMDTSSPEDEVVKAPWFRPERTDGKPTRWQRVVFAIQGGLSEEFVREELEIDVSPLRKRLLDSVDELSKHVHGRENTIIRDLIEQGTVVSTTVAAMGMFLDALHECREAVLTPIAEALDNAAVESLLSDTLMEVDELAPHYSLDEIYVDNVTVHTIGADWITYQVTGSVDVLSNGDRIPMFGGAMARKRANPSPSSANFGYLLMTHGTLITPN